MRPALPSARARLRAPLQLKHMSEDGRFAGYASVFDVIDRQRDVVERGAFRNSLRQRFNEIKLLWQHAPEEPIGRITSMFEDTHGLYIEGELSLDVARAREAHALLKQGVVNGLSIGYAPKRYATDPDSGVRRLQEVELWEVSLVTFPANEKARVTVVKSAEPLPLPTQALRLVEALQRAQSALR